MSNNDGQECVFDEETKVIYGSTDGYVPDPKGLGHAFFNNMKRNRSVIAQVDTVTGYKETFGSLLKRCVRTAIEMKNRGVSPGDIICICSSNNMHNYVPFVSAQLIGAIVASLDPTISVKDSEHLVQLVEPKMVFVSENSEQLIEEVLNNAGQQAEIVTFGDDNKYTPFSTFTQPKEGESSFEPYEVGDSKETAVILFSSGTTGLSKGICINHYGLLFQAHAFASSGCLHDLMLSFATTYWISTVIVLVVTMVFGKSRCIIPKFSPKEIWYDIEKYQVTHLFLAPTYAVQLLKAGRPDGVNISSLHDVVIGGGPLSEKHMRDLQEILPGTYVHLIYGQSEASGILTCFRPVNRRDVIALHEKPSSCGRPITGIQYKVVDPDTEELMGPNERGELRFKSDCQMNGYHKRDGSEAFDEEGWVRTGDIMYFDEDLCFFVVDRIKEMLKFRAFHVTPVIIENVLAAHPDVMLCAVVGVPHEEDGDHPMGLVILKPGSATGEDELVRYVEERVEDKYRLRAGVKIITSVPYTPSGKIKKHILKNMVLRGEI